MPLKNYQDNEWMTQWAGSWSLLSFSYWGDVYCQVPFSKNSEKFVNQVIFVWKKGKSLAYIPKSDVKTFGRKLAQKIKLEPDLVEKFIKDFRAATDSVLNIMDKYINQDISYTEYMEFQNALVYKYYPRHIENKVVVDHLPPAMLEKYLDILEEARVHAEPVFTKSEEFMRGLARIHGNKLGIDAELVLCSINTEFDAYLKNSRKLPAINILQKRYQAAATLFTNGIMTDLLVGDEVNKIDEIVKGEEGFGEIKGTTGYAGKVTGMVRLVTDPQKAENFNKGDILVTGMTRPEFLPLMKKAGAVVTDAGGVLCHAAIVAREMKIPTVIGTEKATKVLKDGDEVEVDAEKGIVKRIQ